MPILLRPRQWRESVVDAPRPKPTTANLKIFFGLVDHNCHIPSRLVGYRTYVRFMTTATEAVAALRAAFDAFAASDIESLPRDELVAVMDDYETLTCQLPSGWHRLLTALQANSTAREMGAKSWNEVLRIRWRLSTAEAGRRLHEAAQLGPRRALTGESLPPLLPVVAVAQAAGLITSEHVKVLRDAVRELPLSVGTADREKFEVDLVRDAVGVGPKELAASAADRLLLLDQDGPVPDERERMRRRGVTVGTQRRDGTTPITGNLDPEATAVWEPLFAKFAAPGMCNPADDEPCTIGKPTQAQIDLDYRTQAQRRHDAMIAVGRIALMANLGQLNGLPVAVVIRTTIGELHSMAGIGTSGSGTKIPIRDVIRMAGHASHHLAIFDDATGAALNYFRARRTASPAQRIMLIARDGGCTKPCCTNGPYHCEVHHGKKAFTHGGNTNVDELTLACGCDNRMVDDHGDGTGYTTKFNARNECEWHPPAALDHGQARVNYRHRPELLRQPPQDGSEWARKMAQLERLLDPPPEGLGDGPWPNPWFDDAYDDSVDPPDYLFENGPWPDGGDGDGEEEAAFLRQFRYISAELEFWQTITSDHTHSGTGLHSP